MMIERLPVMGYAMATDDEHDGSYYRYTEWVAYNFTSSKGKGGGIGCETCVCISVTLPPLPLPPCSHSNRTRCGCCSFSL